MKKITNYICFLLFILILVIPPILLNREKNAMSEIDNKYLAENPFSNEVEGDFTDNFEAYISERMGFRDEEIKLYTVLNDRLFGEMVHPLYTYGKDNYVFFKYTENREYGEYEESLIHMISEIQKYCDDRSIPFVFVFEPSKTSVYADKLSDGYNYNDEWVTHFMERLDEEGINYVDNTKVMKSLRENGIEGFNVIYNAGHWNDVGAFYGTNAIIDNLNQLGVNAHINDETEYTVEYVQRDSLQVSQFPINDIDPVYSLINEESKITDLTNEYDDEIYRKEPYTKFCYFTNNERSKQDCAKALVFQGSYIIGMGYKFLQNSFSEYIGVHDYQNVLDFEYYYDIFKPDCVILDVAQYVFLPKYFDDTLMQTFKLNPLFSEFDNYKTDTINAKQIEVDKGDKITDVKITGINVNADYAYYITNNGEYDVMRKNDSEEDLDYYSVSVENDNYDPNGEYYLIDESSGKKYRIIF